MKTSTFLFAFAALLLVRSSSAQAPPPGSPCGEVNVAKMSVMVMPFTPDGKSPRSVWDENENDRIAVAKVKEFFQGRGFQTVDFLTKLKSAEASGALTLENTSDHKTAFMSTCGAEIIVEVDMTWTDKPGAYHATVILKASEASTAEDMGSTTEISNMNVSDDKSIHAMTAVENQADKFLDQMQRNFQKLNEIGKPVNLVITFSSASAWNMDSEVDAEGGLPLSDVINTWVRDNAYKSGMQQPNMSTNGVEYPQVRIPLRNMETCQPYLAGDHALLLWKYMKGIGIPVKKMLVGNKILITIQ
jgi:hypothetical protein